MNGPGKWMPKQKDGKNWQVDFTCIENGEQYTVSKRFRVRQDAQDEIHRVRGLEMTHAGAAKGFKVISCPISKLS